jgi:uncharacterized protein DUF6629
MCMSAEASFGAAAVLIPASAYCIASAIRKSPAHLLLAAIPLFFAIQQLSEGFVWLGLNERDMHLVQNASLVYLFFAVPFWPLWISLSAACAETRPARRTFLWGLTVLSLVWFFLLYVPVVFDPDGYLVTHVVRHSIHYQYGDLPVFAVVSGSLLRVIYFANVAVPLLVGSRGGWAGAAFGLLLGVGALITAICYWYAFVSVWCFFAAWVSAFECVFFYRLPEGTKERAIHFRDVPGTGALATSADK